LDYFFVLYFRPAGILEVVRAEETDGGGSENEEDMRAA
jgi:hypothetical protein